MKLVRIGLSVATGAVVLAACQAGSRTAAPLVTSTTPATTATTVTVAPMPATTATTSLGRVTTTTTVVVPPPSAPSTAGIFATVTGTYYGGTADSGWLFIRSDGASRYRYPDVDSCGPCTTASAPIAMVDFSLRSLVASGGAGQYQAKGRIMAESDPTTGVPFAGPIGASVTITIGPAGSATVSFLPPNDVLMLPPA